jgi:cellulose synthase/poly-beta-1,6-N-acetylglucosamine synthase-like glycosyltransferase
MALIFSIILYILIFLAVYGQVFYFVTFLENRKKIVVRGDGETKLKHYPSVTITLPCWNEGKTIEKTVQSIFELNYPKEKLQIIMVDDGSVDDTWKIINKFKNYPNVKIFHKENGGKHTAVNLGLENSDSDFFGCLDADSFVDKESLIRIMSYFEKDKEVMAVAPSLVVNDPKGIIQYAQKVEYHMGVYLKKMLGFLGAINVTPGPLTIFRKKVFTYLGPYRNGHNTEDMEIAFRMQKNGYKIDHCNDAFVYTNTPINFKKLFGQRVRWIYGFINNAFDYRSVLLRKKYGNFATFTLPLTIISISSIVYFVSKMMYNFFHFLYYKFIQFSTVGFNINVKSFSFDPFFINMQSLAIVSIAVYFLVIFAMIFGRKMSKEKKLFSLEILYFFPVFGIIAPLALAKGLYNTILSRKPDWRQGLNSNY